MAKWDYLFVEDLYCWWTILQAETTTIVETTMVTAIMFYIYVAQRKCLTAHMIFPNEHKMILFDKYQKQTDGGHQKWIYQWNKNYKILLSGQFFYCWVLFYVQTSYKKPFIPFSFVIFPTKLYYVSIKQMNWINKISSMFWNYELQIIHVV